ncbi:MAG: hypothetical protein AAF439_10445, partial [Pseudomonadota bacterium]
MFPYLSSRFLASFMAFLAAFFVINQADAQNKPITGGYVLSHEHPTNPMAFGGNYAFTGKPGNLRNGVMEEGYTEKAPGCAVNKLCDYGNHGGFLAPELGLGSDMGIHKAHWGPKQNAFSHPRYSTEWIREAWDPDNPDNKDTRLKVMVAFAVDSYTMCETIFYANKNAGAGAGYPCVRGDSFQTNKNQIAALKAWVAANSDWMQIAYNP